MEYKEALKKLQKDKRDLELRIKKHLDEEMRNFEEEVGLEIQGLHLSTNKYGGSLKVDNVTVTLKNF